MDFSPESTRQGHGVIVSNSSQVHNSLKNGALGLNSNAAWRNSRTYRLAVGNLIERKISEIKYTWTGVKLSSQGKGPATTRAGLTCRRWVNKFQAFPDCCHFSIQSFYQIRTWWEILLYWAPCHIPDICLQTAHETNLQLFANLKQCNNHGSYKSNYYSIIAITSIVAWIFVQLNSDINKY